MEIQPVIDSMQKLLDIHEVLLDISRRKTDIIKQGDFDELHGLLTNEEKELQTLEAAETERMEIVKKWYDDENITSNNPRITEMLTLLHNENDKEALEAITIELTNCIAGLKGQEQLNYDLIKQSLQFVNISLDSMMPSIDKVNYGQKNQTKSPAQNHSIFDSKA